MDAETLDRWIHDAKRGDRESYCRIVEALEYRIRVFVAARVPDRHQADELVQDVFVYAFEHLGEYREGTNFTAWLYAIARMTVLAALKSRSRRAKAHGLYVEHQLAEWAVEDLDRDPVDEALSGALRKCLDALPEKDRQLLRLRYDQDMSLQEICARAGRTISWAKSFFFRLTHGLQDCVKRRLAEAGS